MQMLIEEETNWSGAAKNKMLMFSVQVSIEKKESDPGHPNTGSQ